MSLINDTLKNLDKRKKTDKKKPEKKGREEALQSYIETQSPAKDGSMKRLFTIILVGVIAIGGAMAYKFRHNIQNQWAQFNQPEAPTPQIPAHLAKTQALLKEEAAQKAKATEAGVETKEQTLATVTPAEQPQEAIVPAMDKPKLQTLQGINVLQGNKVTEVIFSFDAPVEYQLVEHDETNWLVTFKNAQILNEDLVKPLSEFPFDSVEFENADDHLAGKITLNKNMTVLSKTRQTEPSKELVLSFSEPRPVAPKVPEVVKVSPPKPESAPEPVAAVSVAPEEEKIPTITPIPVVQETYTQEAVPELKAPFVQAQKTAESTPTKKIQFVKKVVNQVEQAEKWFDEGLSLARKGDYFLALSKFKRALQVKPEDKLIRETLVKLQIRMGYIDDASALIEEGLSRHASSHTFWKLKARVLALNAKLNDALKVLEDNKPDMMQDLEYHAFLAALYNQTGQSNRSVTIYERLVAINPTEARWQMGLGIALDNTGHFTSAKKAYQRALDYRGELNRESIEYLKQRIRQIERL